MKNYTKPELTIASFEATDSIALLSGQAQPTPNQIKLDEVFSVNGINFQ